MRASRMLQGILRGDDGEEWKNHVGSAGKWKNRRGVLREVAPDGAQNWLAWSRKNL